MFFSAVIAVVFLFGLTMMVKQPVFTTLLWSLTAIIAAIVALKNKSFYEVMFYSSVAVICLRHRKSLLQKIDERSWQYLDLVPNRKSVK